MFTVRDNGIGIQEQALRIDLPDLQAAARTRQIRGGTGVGLTIVKKIVERHGGRIWVESTSGGGYNFRFHSRWSRKLTMADQQVILVIEDSPEDFEATTRVLRKSGLANPIFRCSDGDEALDFLLSARDLQRSRMLASPQCDSARSQPARTDGRDVLAEIKNDDIHLKSDPRHRAHHFVR